VAVAQWFADESRTAPIDRAIFVSAVARENRSPGTLSVYRWDGVLPDAANIQRAIGDAVTGVIFVDNTLVVTRWMHALPNETYVVEVEPLLHEFGDGLSSPVAAVYDEARSLVLRLATDANIDGIPTAPLGGRAMAERVP
jgi:hypothetical protein